MTIRLLPNFITLSRIAGSLGLLFCDVAGVVFWVLYVLCGITDIADGWVARKSRREQSWCNFGQFSGFGFCGLLLLEDYPYLELPKMAVDLGRSDCHHKTHQPNLRSGDVQKMRLSSHHCQ